MNTNSGAEINGVDHDKTDEDIIKTNLAANAGTNQIKDSDHLLQEMDINRLRAVVYRCGMDYIFGLCNLIGVARGGIVR